MKCTSADSPRSPSAGVRFPGTFAAVVEKIPYLQALGITAVELLPVCDFDDTDTAVNASGEVLRNFWGYNTVAFFSPHAGYCVEPDAATRLTAFRDMVKALHRAGIEVILDVVFNHTGEGDERDRPTRFAASTTGPSTCWIRRVPSAMPTTAALATR